jgi:transposase, IS5 family
VLRMLAKAVGQIARTVARIKAAGGATSTTSRDRRRAAGRRARAIASKLKLRGAQAREQTQSVVQRITGELAELASAAMREAGDVIRNGERACRYATGRRKGQLRRALTDLHTVIERAERVVAQAAAGWLP